VANRKALALQPDNAIALENGIAAATVLGQAAEARKYIAQAQRLGLNGTSLLAVEGGFYASQGDWNGVQKILAEAAGRPDQFAVTSNWASFLPQLGQIQLARTTLLRAADQAAAVKEQDAQAGALLNGRQRRLDGRSMLRSGSNCQRGPEIG
jgi:tetratricopeptide (TPR) repeat protein